MAPILLAIYATGGRHLGRLAAILNPPTLNSSRHETYRTHGSHYDTNQHSSHRALDLYNQWQPAQRAGSHLKPNRYSTADTLPPGTAAILLLTYRTDSSHPGNRLEPNNSHPVAGQPSCSLSTQPTAAILLAIYTTDGSHLERNRCSTTASLLQGSRLAPYPCNQQQPS